MQEAIYFKEVNNTLYIRATGHITASLCTDLKKIVNKRLSTDPSIKEIFVDLSYCDYMDSTFMGLLVGFHKQLMKISQHSLEVCNPTQACQRLFISLGINKILKTISQSLSFPSEMQTISKTATATAELLFKAHENLIEISDTNRKKFAMLQNMLKREFFKDHS